MLGGDARGRKVAEGKRRPVRDGTVWADLVFFQSVLNWACKWMDPVSGQYLLKENMARGFAMPKEKNPVRPVATQDRFEAIRAVADRVKMAVGRAHSRRSATSYLPEILDIVNWTWRRISSILVLRYEDLKLDAGPLNSA